MGSITNISSVPGIVTTYGIMSLAHGAGAAARAGASSAIAREQEIVPRSEPRRAKVVGVCKRRGHVWYSPTMSGRKAAGLFPGARGRARGKGQAQWPVSRGRRVFGSSRPSRHSGRPLRRRSQNRSRSTVLNSPRRTWGVSSRLSYTLPTSQPARRLPAALAFRADRRPGRDFQRLSARKRADAALRQGRRPTPVRSQPGLVRYPTAAPRRCTSGSSGASRRDRRPRRPPPGRGARRELQAPRASRRLASERRSNWSPRST